MTLKFENPNELKEVARREIKDGEIVLKAAGLGRVSKVGVEVVRDGQVEPIEIHDNGDAFQAAWQAYSGYDKPERPHKGA